ncbi:MAG: hypothetical protein HOG89_01570 [Candidatus Peribacter sp.]|jgi:hypothetical protein|nr:hypothetical protein [Candidatus Peribacter sp.]MBT4392498.1 hypothetical protein [Candidatus Peribacter sp.]MBT4601327.1 hypothetical protein [Candidatus Peribacter sp.]MBT5149221.1 hypothetical protein [Candidatus Peribacter sp.]MBT5638053.1 hypothetical protein [Candidatus Peribacter sp.]
MALKTITFTYEGEALEVGGVIAMNGIAAQYDSSTMTGQFSVFEEEAETTKKKLEALGVVTDIEIKPFM